MDPYTFTGMKIFPGALNKRAGKTKISRFPARLSLKMRKIQAYEQPIMPYQTLSAYPEIFPEADIFPVLSDKTGVLCRLSPAKSLTFESAQNTTLNHLPLAGRVKGFISPLTLSASPAGTSQPLCHPQHEKIPRIPTETVRGTPGHFNPS